ncbi:MAG: hypothetical protein JW990_02945, partial [Thermoleophilia bacterium]|nr:hypothetical protein [Thermoleophilia bacterium]
RGAIFLLALLVLVVIFILGASLIERAQTSVSNAAADNRAAASFHFAEAGVQRAVWSLSQPNAWFTYAGESALSLPGGFVDIGVTPAPSARLLDTQVLTILATGWVPGPHGTRRYPCTIRVLTHWEPDLFSFAVFGGESVVVQNGQIRSLNPGNPADIGTNGNVAKCVQVSPEGLVEGNVIVGFDAANPISCVDNKGILGGVVDKLDQYKQLQSVPGLPDGAVALGEVALSGEEELVLEAGTYHVTSLAVSGSAKVTCNGKVDLYVGAESGVSELVDISIGGNGIVNTSAIPSNLTVYCFDNVATVDICGNGALYGALYAPNSVVTLNAGDLYGALVGRQVVMNGNDSTIYYDESLSDETKPCAAVRSWETL